MHRAERSSRGGLDRHTSGGDFISKASALPFISTGCSGSLGCLVTNKKILLIIRYHEVHPCRLVYTALHNAPLYCLYYTYDAPHVVWPTSHGLTWPAERVTLTQHRVHLLQAHLYSPRKPHTNGRPWENSLLTHTLHAIMHSHLLQTIYIYRHSLEP